MAARMEVWRVPWAFQYGFGAHRRANGALMDVAGPREIAAGWSQRIGTSRPQRAGGVARDVSILPGVGHRLGSQPRANTSMTIMRAPQRGHGMLLLAATGTSVNAAK
jgi:hypothetical protein